MKITVNIDCTPEEARRLFGLPDVAPLHEAFLAAARTRMDEALAGLDADAFFKAWAPQGLAAWEQWQKIWREAAAGKTADAEPNKG